MGLGQFFRGRFMQVAKQFLQDFAGILGSCRVTLPVPLISPSLADRERPLQLPVHRRGGVSQFHEPVYRQQNPLDMAV